MKLQYVTASAALLVVACVVSSAAAIDTSAPLQLLSMDTGAACLDGSPYAFYFRNASTSSNTRWSINIEGGGWCYNETLCYERSKTRLGTSTVWPRKGSCGCDFYDEHGVQQEDCNCAYMPYGDGASFSGFREDPWPVEDWPPFDNSTYKVPPGTALHFRGIRNLDATIDFLLSMGMDKATEVRVTGGSAGGLSTFLHMDRIAARVHAVSPHARVTGHPVVGYFLDHDNEAHDEFHTYPLWMSYIYTMQNLTSAPDGGLMRTCTEHYLEKDHYKCFMAPHVQQFVETPYFMYNSKFDAWQMQNILQSSCGASKTVKCNATQQADVLQYGEDFLAAFAPVPPSHRGQNGAFITSCICHGCPWSDLVLEGLSAPQALAKWYLAGATGGVKDDGNDHVYVDTRNPNGNGTLVKGPFEECVKFP